MVKDAEVYIGRLKELREQIEKRTSEKTIEQLYDDTFSILTSMIGKKTPSAMVESFEKDFVKKGKMQPQDLRILKNIISARADFKKGKLNVHKVDDARKEAAILMNDLIEYNQRCDLNNSKEVKK